MKTEIDNPSAFPIPELEDGMTLRDYFAAQVLAETYAIAVKEDEHDAIKIAASSAYQIADTMLERRKGGGR